MWCHTEETKQRLRENHRGGPPKGGQDPCTHHTDMCHGRERPDDTVVMTRAEHSRFHWEVDGNPMARLETREKMRESLRSPEVRRNLATLRLGSRNPNWKGGRATSIEVGPRNATVQNVQNVHGSVMLRDHTPLSPLSSLSSLGLTQDMIS